MFVSIYLRMYLCVFVCMYVCMYVYKCVCMYMYIHTSIYVCIRAGMKVQSKSLIFINKDDEILKCSHDFINVSLNLIDYRIPPNLLHND